MISLPQLLIPGPHSHSHATKGLVREGALTSILARGRSSRCTSLRLTDDAKVVSHATLAPDVAANIQWTRVEHAQVCACRWLYSARHLCHFVSRENLMRSFRAAILLLVHTRRSVERNGQSRHSQKAQGERQKRKQRTGTMAGMGGVPLLTHMRKSG